MENFTSFVDGITIFPSGTSGETDILDSITHVQYMMFLKIQTAMVIVVAVSGIASNIINIRVFLILGFKDGVNMSFLTLSACDLLFLCVHLTLQVFTVFLVLEEKEVVWFRFHPFLPIVFTTAFLNICSTISMFNVTFLAVARCACVSMPLRFKNIFTSSLCLGFFISSLIFSFGAYAPTMTQLGVQNVFDTTKNSTRVFLSLGRYLKMFLHGTNIFFDTTCSFATQIILIVCIIIMSYKLQASAKFRNSQMKGNDDKMAKLSSRDLNVLRQVYLISIIYIVANTPKVFIALYGLIESEFFQYRRYHYFYVMSNAIRLIVEGISATSNFFVYCYFNSSFRSACFSPKSGKISRTAQV